MAKDKNKKTNPIAGFGGKVIDLAKFNIKSDKEQYEEIKKTLEDIYQDNLKVTRKHIMKVIGLTLVPKDDYVYLPYNLKVSKEKLNLRFEVVKKKTVGLGLIIFGIWLFVFALVAATYAGFRYLSLADLNKDIDGDGIADINIDINGDNYADINIDTNNDDKPNINIDYKGNRKSVFNIDKDGDGKSDYNLVNDASDDEKRECKINCDIDGDGWPDINLDLDGDGEPDTDIDTDNDGIPDLNLDIDGDGKCDVMCDTDGDNKCDYQCIKPDDDGKNTGSSSQTGDPNTNSGSTTLMLNFVDGVTVNVDNLYPDDQPGVAKVNPYKTFTVENLSNNTIIYSLKFKVIKNTFVTNNFQYKVEATNGGGTLGYTPAPKKDAYIVRNVSIPARVSQKYKITFNLAGTNKPQNQDQGKNFTAEIDVEL